MEFPVITLARHGQTEWSLAGKHTGKTDLELTPAGEKAAGNLGRRLKGGRGKVFTSPLKRASGTAALAGFPGAAVDYDLVEWDYGEYEGLTTEEIQAKRPGWELFRDGCPGGEDSVAVAVRADRVIERLRELNDDAILFSSGHILRMVTVRWLGQGVGLGKLLQLDTGTLSELGYYHNLGEPCLRLWNDGSHLTG